MGVTYIKKKELQRRNIYKIRNLIVFMAEKEVTIKSTPASRWVQRYKKRYFYTFGVALIFIGLFSLIFSKAFGISMILLGILLIIWNNKYLGKK